ncbi:D-alanyl-D-alanine carboxypeptidase family protein [Inconstantimicrobium mannanitabidum]|uniref:D-alanyl-D-alanine carboxypeptidase n=1 Tax=Inconstantimicrobium mannanitabidum TaxID=1604901 RepID=A0ACB5RCJ0_9CLOT|nr:D-alanyl-D-alanine carboxypeptidase family protein [Clostridium sp. TW13]GKX66806.1 D-alanyl-D-alanine carboxypeptidase [Clostridium sp. TW13]
MRRKRIISTLAIACFITVLAPTAKIAHASETQPSVVGQSAITVDYETGEIIYAKDIDTKRYPASITKLITGLVFAEKKQKSDTIPYTEDAKTQPAESFSANYPGAIKVGETMTADDVMKSLLLFSANDAATMMADSIAGNTTDFAKLMNDKAKALGLSHTHFVTPNGLHDDDHYTTAYDLSILTKAAFHNDWIKEVMGTEKAKVSISNGKSIDMTNLNNLLGKDGNIGGKTGTTSQAGKCLTSVYDRDGRKIIGVVLKSTRDTGVQVFKDMNSIIDWSYKQQKSVFLPKGKTIETVKVSYKPLRFFGPTKTIDVPITLNENIEYYKNAVNDKELKTKVIGSTTNAWDLAKNSSLVKVRASQRAYSKDYSASAQISTSTLVKDNLGLYAICLVVAAVVIFLILFIINLIKANNRKRSKKKGIF